MLARIVLIVRLYFFTYWKIYSETSFTYILTAWFLGELEAFKGCKAERKTVVINHGLDNTFGVFYGPQMSKQEWNVTQNSNLE